MEGGYIEGHPTFYHTIKVLLQMYLTIPLILFIELRKGFHHRE